MKVGMRAVLVCVALLNLVVASSVNTTCTFYAIPTSNVTISQVLGFQSSPFHSLITVPVY